MVTKELTVLNEIEMTTLREIIPQDSPVYAIIAEKIGHQKSACKLFKKHRAEIEAGKQHDETANLAIEEIDNEDESDVDSLSELGF